MISSAVRATATPDKMSEDAGLITVFQGEPYVSYGLGSLYGEKIYSKVHLPLGIKFAKSD